MRIIHSLEAKELRQTRSMCRVEFASFETGRLV
jgi:hypothetical protein